ncbi:MAG: hypothetical protein J7647_27795 [Cyanobacteria bacterium SBLK]|nr:hypothetical protein [Cyanobacteria bacterium SBLK]
MNARLNFSIATTLTSVLLLGAMAARARASSFNAADDFSITDNPNGAWQYGWSESLGSTFNLLDGGSLASPTVEHWQAPDGQATGFNSFMMHNLLDEVNLFFETISLEPNQLALHPGENGAYSVLRWVAPETGNYSLSGVFTGQDMDDRTTSDVHILYNGVSLFSNFVNGSGAASAQSFTTTQLFQAGDVIDFAVGYGANQDWSYDSTGLDATIETVSTEPVPEPSVISGLALLALVASGKFVARGKSIASEKS